ncbi:MAG: hypothetical protein HN564_05105 [Flavobacteriales bacterium]|nr:hypothetical protein [Flavobacteriales bacterium]
MVQKPKKIKKLKKKTGDPLMNSPLEPDEMETELLDDRENNELDPRRRLDGMRVGPYTDNETQYQNNKKVVDLDFNNNIVRADMMRNIKRESVLSDDPDYQEFLEFKKTRMMKSKKHSVRNLDSSSEEQFNELLLYVFTGFFLLMIYDNIYKLGRDSFY